MEKNVIISIKGVQRLEDADPDTMELVTEGRLEQDGNSYTLSYQESELTGLEGYADYLPGGAGPCDPAACGGVQLSNGVPGGPPPPGYVQYALWLHDHRGEHPCICRPTSPSAVETSRSIMPSRSTTP